MNKMIKKVMGKFLYSVIGQHLPTAHCKIKVVGKFSKRFRGFCGKLILEKCGKNVNIYPHASFSSKVQLGDNSDIGLRARINGKCIIGDNVIMGPEVWIYTVNHNTSNIDVPIKYQGNTEEKAVYIGDDSWICARVTILPGVKIGKGVVIGAGAVVSKDIPDYAIAVGNPATVVKYRNR